MRAEEAEIEPSKFLDDAVMARLEKFELCMGKGEGILREMTHQILKLRSDVADYHDADPAEGGFGVTVVHFK
jgi:DNA mismatch repair protein MutS2